jgi:hypothetical protein
MQKIIKIGSNRGTSRIWLEGQCLAAEKWIQGTPFKADFEPGRITYTRTPDAANPDRRVAGTDTRPIIDTNTAKIGECFPDCSHVVVSITADAITITPGKAPIGKLSAVVAAAVVAVAALLPVGFPYVSKFAPNAQRVLVACEESATVRDAFTAKGHDAVSVDLLETRNPYGWHVKGDVSPYLAIDWDLVIGFPPCTFLTNSAAWAFKDPDFKRYPGVGYHQRVKAGTLTGEDRRNARIEAVAFALEIYGSCERVAIENPCGSLSTMFREPDQVIQPFQFGHDASKKTCLWLKGLEPLEPTKYIEPRLVCPDCKSVSTYAAAFGKGCGHCGAEAGRLRPRWANQTDSGQNKIGPSDDRDKMRSETYQGIADAMALRWG